MPPEEAVAAATKAPATEAPPTPPTPPEGVKERIAAARDRLEKGEPLIPKQETGEVSEPEESGLISPGAEGLPSGAEPAPVEATGEDSDDVGGSEPEAHSEAEGEEDVSGGTTEESEPAFTLQLPPRREGEDPIELQLTDASPEQIEGLRRLQNNGMRRQEFEESKAELETAAGQVERVLDQIQADPIGFLTQQIPASHRLQVARSLLADGQVFEALKEDIENWSYSPDARERVRAETEANSLRTQRQIDAQAAERTQYRQNAELIHTAVADMASPDWDRGEKRFFIDSSLSAIKAYITNSGATHLDTSQVRPILEQAGILSHFRLNGSQPSTTGPSEGAPPKGVTPESRRLEEARGTGERFRQVSAKKRAAAATAPAGAGAAPSMPKPPPGQGVKERIDWWRKNRLS
jgi:hypothetical protein